MNTEDRHAVMVRLDLMASGDDQWDLSDNDRAAIRMALREMAMYGPAPHEQYVRCSREFVAELLAAPSQPVTIQIETRRGNELHFSATRHDCPDASALQQGDAE
jgi:hypothetical protein